MHNDRSVRHRTADRASIEQSRVCLSRSIGPRAPPYGNKKSLKTKAHFAGVGTRQALTDNGCCANEEEPRN